MQAPRLGSGITSAPSNSPITSIPLPPSANGHYPHTRLVSDAASTSGSSDTDSGNVRVVLRVRPADHGDDSIPPRFRKTLVHPSSSGDVRVDVDPATLIGHGGAPTNGGSKRHQMFCFDHVLGEDSSQVDLYDVTGKEIVEEFMTGHNVTFLAYGQTSSGKSYSMGTTGDESDCSGVNFNPRTGLIPRTVQSILERAEAIRRTSGAGASWECRISFLELYNEEIIDLLSGSGISISIREERDGRIIWAGVREVKVKSLTEVMQLLQDGSARRKTGETEMNATSSRSHAIFSLTLIQKKRATIVTSASQPISQNTPTRNSTIGFSSIGRSQTPSGRSATPSGSRPGPPPSSFISTQRPGLTRPNSMHVGDSVADNGFVVVTSKFNMVDLAGSERLKRTAAQGDRMKEGISINSGLLALGNVISTLCDPVKARGHIPYRDSKLTRMLQDSIGGNALTTMIACVSGIEYNIGETLNTIKYASRARSIKNAAKINEVEAGWDDFEHLQNTVTKLRKQLAAIQTHGNQGTTDMSPEGQTQHEKLIQRLAELQREHSELYERYLQKCNECIRLTSELRSAQPADADALAKFNETVEPVILEYEKVVCGLNSQLDNLNLELTAINDLYEEQSSQMVVAQRRQLENENYVAELRGRVAKLSERNTASETYIHILEGKLQLHSDKDASSSEVVGDLKKEMAKLRESNLQFSNHTSELETRLANSEAHSTSLACEVKNHEKEAEQRESAYRDLESHVALLDTSKDSQSLLDELEHREKRITELERNQEDMRETLELGRARLAADAEGETTELRVQLASLNVSTSTISAASTNGSAFENARAITGLGPSPGTRHKELTPPDSPQPQRENALLENNEVVQLRDALRLLTARCAVSELQSNQAQVKVNELTSQLSEAKLIHAELDDALPTSPIPVSSILGNDASDDGSTVQTPRGSSSPSSSPTMQYGSRRSPLPVLNVATSGMATVVRGRDFRGGRGSGESKRARPQSLSQELSSARLSAFSPSTSWAGPSSLLFASSPDRQIMPAMQKSPRSPQSLEAELKFVHGVIEERDAELKDREAYIRQLERSLRESRWISSSKSSVLSVLLTPGASPQPCDIPLPASPLASNFETDEPDLFDRRPSTHISPRSNKEFSLHRGSFDQLKEDAPSAHGTQLQMNELAKEMKDKEASQREMIDQQYIRIANLQKANYRLKYELYEAESATALSPNQPRHSRGVFDSEKVERSLTSQTIRSTEFILDRLRSEHAGEQQKVIQAHDEAIGILQQHHVVALTGLRDALASATTDRTSLDSERNVFEGSIADLERKHAEAIASLQRDNELISKISKEFEMGLMSNEEQRRQLKIKADQALFEQSRTCDEHFVRRNSDHRQIAELGKANAAFERVKEELETANIKMMERIAELEHRISRTTSALPPEGPPPDTPLPPLPSSILGVSPKTSEQSHTMSMSSSRSVTRSLRLGIPKPDISDPISPLPEPDPQMIQHVSAEVDITVMEKASVKQKSSYGVNRETEEALREERVRSEGLTKEVYDARKTNSKLRAHLEDARQEARRVVEECKNHMEDLSDRRARMSTLSEESGRNRDSLVAANAQLETLKAQLDRAVDHKVNKKLGQRLKCF